MSVYVNPHHYTNMKSIFIQQFIGSSFVSPALGVVGQGRLININDKFPPKKSGEARKQAGKKEGGLGEGIFARLPKRSPAALLAKSRVQKKSFLFLLEEKEIARQIKKCEENFFAGQRAKRAVAGLASLLGVLLKKSSNINQKTPPIFTFCEIVRNSLGAKRLGMVFFRYFEGIFEIQNQSAVGNAEVRTNLFEKIPNPFGIFLLSVFFGLVGLF